MSAPHRQSFWPGLVGITGHHITQHGPSLSQWDLRIDFRNGAITVDAVTLEQALAFIDCAHRMLIHEGQPPAQGLELPDIDPSVLQDLAQDAGIKFVPLQSPDEIRTSAGFRGRTEPPAAGEAPEDPSGAPRTDPPSTGPEPAAACERKASGGWIPPGTAMQITTAMVLAGEYVLPRLPPAGACFGGEWIVPPSGPWSSLEGRQAQFEVRFDQTAPRPYVLPQVVHLKPGEVINLTCSCQTIAGGTLSDDPNCQMHHGVPTVYVFDGC